MYGNTCCDVKGHGTSISPSIAHVISGFVASDSESKKTLSKGGISDLTKLSYHSPSLMLNLKVSSQHTCSIMTSHAQQLGRITSSTGAAVLVLARIGNSILITPGVAVICLANPAHL